ncbi:hypothetical protein CDL15_Pgr019202 [Punica granatum]|uniref:Reverse transcriptase domain-containing protein n=1 Tax=Punica granatum TaxID=22663 RepID=A0A218W639_PUNGR|nr:hypothetical protein CDL15_Pgr019202 [Punica granatum]
MKNMKARRGQVSMKIDFMKAFDRLEWSFITTILRNFGFQDKCISRIFQCISTSSFSILINDSPYGYFQPERGKCQGDPISPYLFVLATEELFGFFYRAIANKERRGIRISRDGLTISHLMFIDDLLVLTRASLSEVQHTKHLLDKFYP